MTTPAPPWCLQWRSDGELTWIDRQDLIERLVAHQEPGIARSALQQLLPIPAAPCHRRVTPAHCRTPH
jgi:hypothetical protein